MITIVYRKGKSLCWHCITDAGKLLLFPTSERAIEVFWVWSFMGCLPNGHDFRLCFSGVVDSVPVESYFASAGGSLKA